MNGLGEVNTTWSSCAILSAEIWPLSLQLICKLWQMYSHMIGLKKKIILRNAVDKAGQVNEFF